MQLKTAGLVARRFFKDLGQVLPTKTSPRSIIQEAPQLPAP